MRLLLNAHISPSIARQLQRAGVDAVAARDWHDGNYRTAPDGQILAAASAEERVLVTYDLRTIPLLLKEWAETGQRHRGVILIDEKTLRPSDVGGLLRALQTLANDRGEQDWGDRVVFLRARSSTGELGR